MSWKEILKFNSREEEQAHLDSRRDKRRQMGLKGNMSFPRKERRHRGGRGRLGDTKLLPIPKEKILVRIPETAINYKLGYRFRNPTTGDEFKVHPFGYTLTEE